MALMKVSGQAQNAPFLPVSLAAGEAMMLPVGQGVVGQFGGVSFPQLATNNPLTGQYLLQLGLLTNLQQYDAALQYWRTVQVTPYQLVTCSADGANYRIVNSTGCPVGAYVTTNTLAVANGFYGFNASGAAITIVGGVTTLGNAVFTITPNAGGSLWNSVVGGAANTTMGFSGVLYNGSLGNNGAFGATTGSFTGSGGSNYTKPPLIVFSPPANQGAQPYVLPTATCTISGGVINAITVVNQGAGLMGLPGVTVVPQPGDTTGGGALIGWTGANNGDAAAGKLLLMWPAYYGAAQTAPVTFTFSPAGPAATAIMNFTVTSITNTTPGVGYTNAFGVWQGGVVVATPANTNPVYDKQLSLPIFPPISVVAGTGVTTLAAGFGGVNIQVAPTLAFGTQLAAGTVTTVAVQTPVVGGASDTFFLCSI